MKDSWIPQDVHYLATILHPKVKHFHMGAPSDREKAVQLLKLEIQKRRNQQTTKSSQLCNHSSSFSLCAAKNNNSKTPQKKNVLARCFDPPSSGPTVNDRECEEYLNSTTTIDSSADDDGDGEFLVTSFSFVLRTEVYA